MSDNSNEISEVHPPITVIDRRGMESQAKRPVIQPAPALTPASPTSGNAQPPSAPATRSQIECPSCHADIIGNAVPTFQVKDLVICPNCGILFAHPESLKMIRGKAESLGLQIRTRVRKIK